ncbi:MAG: hypothetical protein AB1486_19065 [Planctomycetota bacterium]
MTARNRVNRGGSFNNVAINARSANRNNNTPENRNNNLGCRPAAKVSNRLIVTVASPHRRAVHRDTQIRLLCRPRGWPKRTGPPGVVGRLSVSRSSPPATARSPIWRVPRSGR